MSYRNDNPGYYPTAEGNGAYQMNMMQNALPQGNYQPLNPPISPNPMAIPQQPYERQQVHSNYQVPTGYTLVPIESVTPHQPPAGRTGGHYPPQYSHDQTYANTEYLQDQSHFQDPRYNYGPPGMGEWEKEGHYYPQSQQGYPPHREDDAFRPHAYASSNRGKFSQSKQSSLEGHSKRSKEIPKAKSKSKSKKKSESSESEEEVPLETKVKSKKPAKIKKPLNIVKSPKGLQVLGNMHDLTKSDDIYKTIEKYAKNSCNVDENVEIKIHKIVEFDNLISTKKPSNAKAKVQNRSLLWFKTTPNSVAKLVAAEDGHIAFYDRLARVLATYPKPVKEPLRQTILLCSVSLGKEYKSPNGLKHWASRGIPEGYNSIKASGKYTPDWSGNRDDTFSTIPCGKTMEDGRYKSYQMDYSEYIIHEIARARVRYAVDVEFTPGEEDDEDDDDGESSEEESDYES